MRAYGTDRLREAGGRWILHSRHPKGWTARVARTLTSAEFPGTAVYCDEEYFECVAAETLPAGGYRYVLERWKDEHAIRQFEAYDDASEARRAAEHAAALRRERNRKSVNFVALLAGHLPSTVQEHLASELGIVSTRMTLLSTLPQFALFAWCIYAQVSAYVDNRPLPISFWGMLGAGYLLVDFFVRAFVAAIGKRPLGSFPGFLAYIVYYYSMARNRARLPAPFARAKGESSSFTLPPPDDIAIRDTLMTRGAFFTLLSRDEQNDLAARYGFNYREHARGMAWIILLFSLAGAVAALVQFARGDSPFSIITVLVAGALALEQIKRLATFGSGPAGSVLAFAVRPFARDLLERR